MSDTKSANEKAAALAREAFEKEKALLREGWRVCSLEEARAGEDGPALGDVEQPGGGVGHLVRLVGRRIDHELQALYSKGTAGMAVVAAPGAGQALTASGARSHGERLRLGAVDVDIALKWTAKWMEVEWLVEPPSPDPLILFFEDPAGAGPLTAVALDASAGRSFKKRLSREQLGFDPTSCPWQIRVGSAHEAG